MKTQEEQENSLFMFGIVFAGAMAAIILVAGWIWRLLTP